jgi:hypothetical protein
MDEGMLMVGKVGGSDSAGGGGDGGTDGGSSVTVGMARGGVCETGDLIGEPFVMSESTEKREIGRGFPKLSLEKRSGRGGVGLPAEPRDTGGFGGGERTGPWSCSWTRTC